MGDMKLSDYIDFENNKSLALHKLESLERSLRCQPDIAERYSEVLKVMKRKGLSRN